MNASPEEIQYENSHVSQNLAPGMVAASAVLTILALVSVGTRFLVRKMNCVSLGLDDYLILGALACGIGLFITIVLLGNYGIGRHLFTLNSKDLVMIGKLSFVFEIFYPLCITLTKLSILALFKNVFSLNNRQFALCLYLTLTWVILWCLGTYLLILLQCKPIASYWSLEDACRTPYIGSVLDGAFNAVSDVALIVLPQPLLWKLQLNFNRKISISLLFGLASSAVIISIIRIPILREVGHNSPDSTYNGIPSYVLTLVEPVVGIICACLPITQNVVRKLPKKNFGITSLISKLTGSGTSRNRSDYGINNTDGSSQPSNWVELKDAKAGTKHDQFSRYKSPVGIPSNQTSQFSGIESGIPAASNDDLALLQGGHKG